MVRIGIREFLDSLQPSSTFLTLILVKAASKPPGFMKNPNYYNPAHSSRQKSGDWTLGFNWGDCVQFPSPLADKTPPRTRTSLHVRFKSSNRPPTNFNNISCPASRLGNSPTHPGGALPSQRCCSSALLAGRLGTVYGYVGRPYRDNARPGQFIRTNRHGLPRGSWMRSPWWWEYAPGRGKWPMSSFERPGLLPSQTAALLFRRVFRLRNRSASSGSGRISRPMLRRAPVGGANHQSYITNRIPKGRTERADSNYRSCAPTADVRASFHVGSKGATTARSDNPKSPSPAPPHQCFKGFRGRTSTMRQFSLRDFMAGIVAGIRTFVAGSRIAHHAGEVI